jgi:hypothetical protein
MERKTIIWSIAITFFVIIAIWLGALAWLNNPINNAFGPEPSTYCEQDSDCRYSYNYCPAIYNGCPSAITNTGYQGPLCPFPRPAYTIMHTCETMPELICVEQTCVIKRG